jgi:hypothetical protein
MKRRFSQQMAKKHFLAVTNLGSAILLAGITIGSFIFSARPVYAQSDTEEVTPSTSTGTALFNTALAHRVVADQIIVGDHDMGKLLEGLMNLMSSTPVTFGGPVYTRAQLQSVIDASRVDRPIRLAPTHAAAPAPAPAPK